MSTVTQSKVSTQLPLDVNRSKTKIMNANIKEQQPQVTLDGEPLEETDSFTYLGRYINKPRGTEDVKANTYSKSSIHHVEKK